jgi:hypothetical protein
LLIFIGSIIIAIILMTKGRVGQGVAMLVVSIAIAIFAAFFWIGFTEGMEEAAKEQRN